MKRPSNYVGENDSMSKPTTSPAQSMGARSLTVVVCFLLALGVLALSATAAQAATPAWKVIGITGPSHLAPQSSEIQSVAVDATGGSYALSQETATGTGTLSVKTGFGNLTSGSTAVTGVLAFGGPFVVGQPITHPAIPPGTTIAAFTPGFPGSLTLSAPATATVSFAQLTSASNEVTSVTTTSGSFHVGDRISGTGIPNGTTITAVGSGTLTLSAAPTAGGSPELTATETTAPIAFDAPATGAGSVQAALEALPAFGNGSVSVVGGPGGPGGDDPYAVTFGGGSFTETDVAQLTADTTDLDGDVLVETRVGGGPGTGIIKVNAANIGGIATSGAYTVEIDLPPGLTTTETPSAPEDVILTGQDPWDCVPAGTGQSSVSCTRSAAVESGTFAPVIIMPVQVGSGAIGQSIAEISVSGGGAAQPASYDQPITVSQAPAGHGVQAMWAGAFDENGNPETRAGAHPFNAMAMFFFNTKRSTTGQVVPVEPLKEVNVELPAGFVANPMITPRCPRDNYLCDVDAQVGTTFTEITQFAERKNVGYDQGFYPSPLSNVLPPKGSPAQLSLHAFTTRINTTAKLRQDDYGVTSVAAGLPTDLNVFSAAVTLWGQSSHPAHDNRRCTGNDRICPESIQGGVDGAFVTNPTECTGQNLPTRIGSFSWINPTVYAGPASDNSPPVTDCANVPFAPAVSVTPTSTAADSASGLDFAVELPQDGLLDFDGIATSHLKDVTVDLPAGIAVNPSSATGLAGCSDAQMAIGSESAPQCPDGSKLGTVEITSPLVDRPVGGTMYLGVPKSTDPMSGEMLRLFVVARNDDLGVMIKLPGSATADPQTGKLTATFENNPRLPFDHLSVKLKGGDRGVLAMPQACGPKAISSTLSPWSGTVPVTQSSPFDVAGDCSAGFAPALTAGNSNPNGRGSGTFSFKFSRRDGEQWIDGLTATLPQGLLASVKGVPLCTSDQAAAGACPAASRIGTVDATAGSGNPFVLEQKGSAYLTEGYKGCAYGLAVVVPVVAGPFDKSSPATDLGNIVVRQSICVDRTTAQVTATSDPFPTIWHGIPLRVRSVTVNVDRPGFMLNPSDCSAKQVGGTFHSVNGATAAASSAFQASGCGNLPFEPTLALALTGKKQVRTGKHPGVKATVTQQGVVEAGIERAEVRLPKSLALDPANAQALCEFEDGTSARPEDRCPKGSIVGRARAVSPLLNDPLVGNVYFVKNVRRSSTGNLIRTLPMLIVALRGEIAINLKGESDTTKSGKLVNTFASVPDAPISRFDMNIKGGGSGILAVTRTRRGLINLCAKPKGHVAETDMDGHNGKRRDFDVRMKTPCTKRQTKAAKRSAAAKAAQGKR
jgi:hypothetical protein